MEQQESQENQSSVGGKMDSTSLAIGLGGTGLLGCMGIVLAVIIIMGVVVECAIGVLLWPLVLICHIFGCGGGGGAQVDQDAVVTAYKSDGTGPLEADSVPEDLLQVIRDAGNQCTQIGPIVIAAQIQQVSGWNRSLVGPNGREGISQMPPDKFTKFGEDRDDNGKTSALDPEDSIMAQGKYLCSLAGDVKQLLNDNAVTGNALDLTLAAYDVGEEAIKQARGVPDTDQVQSYIAGIRGQFALYSGAIKPPDGSPYPTISAYPTLTSASTPTPTTGQ
ncbi:transglycosylase SLT domain-containing protein [Streptomyces sp. NPDC048281]|uniref:transglycosylase SLT domain-containing protein n=1 Tax=Streptomyces sp. NPDC048281 TaxID=3154715 RepID=UPI00343A858E